MGTTTKLVLLALAECVNGRTGDPVCWPGQDRLAEMCGVSVRQVRRVIRELIDSKLITVSRRGNDQGGRSSDLYTLLISGEEDSLDEGGNRTSASGNSGEVTGHLEGGNRPPVSANPEGVTGHFGQGNRTFEGGLPDISGEVTGHPCPGNRKKRRLRPQTSVFRKYGQIV